MGNYSKHVIEVETKFVTVNGKSMVDSKKTVEGLGRGVTQTTTSMRDWDSEGKKMISTGRTLTKGFQKFQMENLGVMFAGMALNRTMSTLNATSREWLGIGELTSTMMGITMLDANMDLLQFGILPLFDALTNLPPAAQKAIGLTAIALEGLGGVMMVGGQFMLGLDSTATLLAKVAGVRPEIIFSSKGLSALKTNLQPLSGALLTIGKLAVIAVTLSEIKNDIEQGEVTAAIGTALAGYGIVRGNKWAIAVGLVLKLTGDEGAQKMLAKFLLWMSDKVYAVAEWIGDTLVKALTFDWENVDTSFFSNLGQSFSEAGEEMRESGSLSSDFLNNKFDSMSSSADGYEAKLQKITDKYETGGPKWLNAVESLNNEYDYYLDYLDESNLKLQRHNELWGKLSPNIKSMFSGETSSSAFSTPSLFDFTTTDSLGQGMSTAFPGRAIGGNIGSSGSYYLHEGETVLRKDQAGNQSGNITVTYNVNVSDKREFEQMLRANNDKLTADVRRMSKI